MENAHHNCFRFREAKVDAVVAEDRHAETGANALARDTTVPRESQLGQFGIKGIGKPTGNSPPASASM